MKRILILMHEYQRSRAQNYLIDALAKVWQSWGLEVTYAFGVKERTAADLLIPHIDLTQTPPEYIEFIQSYPAATNRTVFDISKRSFGANLLRGDEEYCGPVIVKTNCNGSGVPEHRLFQYHHPLLAGLRRKGVPLAERLLGRRFAWQTMLRGYPIYNSLAEVPAGVFKNPALVVERFLPENEGERYFMRHYLFLGDHCRSVRVEGLGPFLKRASCKLVDEGLEVPAPVLELRQRLGMDYGKIDYVVHEGQAVILDVNRTVGVPGGPELTARTVADLVEGICSLLPGGRAEGEGPNS